MMWRFSFASTSTLDNLLSRETPPSVEEVMEESDVLQECKAQNNKLVNFLSRDESIKSLLHWVVSGLDELDEQSRQAEKRCLAQARGEGDMYPSYKAQPSSPNEAPATSPPMEPAKLAQESLSVEEKEPDLSAGNMGVLSSGAPGSEEDEAQRARYPNVAAEILTSEIWVIPETILANKETLLRPFWDAVVPPLPESDEGIAKSPELLYETSELYRARVEYGTDEDDERDRRREVIRGLWVKVNGSLLTKRTHETIPDVIPRLIAQIHSPAIQDILIRLISAEEAGVPGVIQWLAEEHLVTRLISFLSPLHPPHVHVLATELLKNVITLCAPPPFNPLGGNMQEQQSAQGSTSGNRDNRMVRELVSEESIRKLVGYMLDPLELSDIAWKGLNGDGTPHPADPFIVHPLPSVGSASSSLSNISTIFVELIRRNNSDFAEPHLFHTLRNRLINMRMEQGAPLGQMEEGDKEDQDRERMEEAVKGMSEAMGIVHLRSLLDILCQRFERLNQLLLEPRAQKHSASPLFPLPLTLERFRIVELFAELLHSSNMSILNRPTGTGPEYSYDGILSGGLAGLEALGEAIDEDRDMPPDSAPEEQVTQARELPVSSNASTDASLSSVGSDSEDEKMLEDIEEENTPSGSPAASRTTTRTGEDEGDERQLPEPSQADVARLRDVMNMEPPSSGSSDLGAASHIAQATTTVAPSVVSDEADPSAERPASASEHVYPPGERLKQVYLQYRVLPTLIDMFFDYASNDFLHHVVYDMLQQILNGKLTPGPNRQLVEEMICEAKLVERVLKAQEHNDQIVTAKKPRLPYMGHIILIAEEVVKFLSRSPPDLLDIVLPHIPQPQWDNFVLGQLQETRARDGQPLAGGKPVLGGTTGDVEGGTAKSEDEESSSDSDDDDPGQLGGFGTFGEPLQRTKATEGYVSRGEGSEGEDAGSEEESNERYWRNTAGSRRHVDSSDEDEDDGDWLRPNDDFGGFNTARGQSDDFDDDELWGSFSSGSAAANTSENPFGDDNFAPLNDTFSPSVPARPAAGTSDPEPVTPRDWFNREFATAWKDDEEDVPAIVMPNGEEADDEPGLPNTPGSTWSFSGDDEGEDLPLAVSPVIGQDTEPEERDIGEGVAGLGITESKPISIPPNPQSDDSALSTSPHSGPIPDRSTQTAPVAVPSSPQKTRRPPPPPSPRKRRASSQSTEKPRAGSISESDPSLVAATTETEPLGPGVGSDVEVTEEGMLKREVDGKEVVVPKDEVAMGVEEAKEK